MPALSAPLSDTSSNERAGRGGQWRFLTLTLHPTLNRRAESESKITSMSMSKTDSRFMVPIHHIKIHEDFPAVCLHSAWALGNPAVRRINVDETRTGSPVSLAPS